MYMCTRYKVKANGKFLPVYDCDIGSFCILSSDENITFEVEVLFPFKNIKIRPLSKNVSCNVDGNVVSFVAGMPCKLSMEFDNNIRNPLFILVNPAETNMPSHNSSNVKFFGSGKIHEVGEIVLKDNDTVYIEEGAIVKGIISAENCKNISVLGRGILDGSFLSRDNDRECRKRMIQFVNCEDVLIDGITIFNGNNWHVVPIACKNVCIKNINIIAWEGTGDGIDVVGSENVDISNCFIRTNDDCIAIKAVDYFHEAGNKNVRNIVTEKCVLWNAEWGNAVEIGYETRCDMISNIIFRDCDIIRCEFEGYQSGGTLTIHNGDRAHVSDVLYEDIRIEDSREKLIDIKILHSQYSKDISRGQISNIAFKNISIVDGSFPVSIIRGFDADHMIKDISIQNLNVNGKKITNATDAKMVIELSKNITFE